MYMIQHAEYVIDVVLYVLQPLGFPDPGGHGKPNRTTGGCDGPNLKRNLSIYIFIYLSIYLSVYLSIHTYIYIYIYMNIYIYIHIYIYIYVYIYMSGSEAC